MKVRRLTNVTILDGVLWAWYQLEPDTEPVYRKYDFMSNKAHSIFFAVLARRHDTTLTDFGTTLRLCKPSQEYEYIYDLRKGNNRTYVFENGKLASSYTC